MAKATSGNNAQFTYDFGIAIAQSTVNKLTRLTGATLTLASAFYALRASAEGYVETLRENALRFGGILSTMKAMEQAQDRLIKGQSYFGVKDQLKGMNQLMAAGIKVGENFEWINKAAHATGKSYAEFSGMIASAIQGNSYALVEAGLMTQRATRIFDKYAANTVMRQQAILNFVKTHKGLMNAIKNDFETVQDQMVRIKSVWQTFLHSIVGKPNDPSSFYGQVVASMKTVAVSLARNAESIKRYGYIIGQTLGWVIKQIGYFVVWVGRKVKEAISSVWSVTDDFQNQAKSLVVWLEFWKLKVLDFFKEYGGLIKNVLKLLIAYKLLKGVFVIGSAAIASVVAYKKAIMGLIALQKRYISMMGPYLGNRFTRWLQSLAVFMPKWLRKMWVSVGKFFETNLFGGGFARFGKTLMTSFFGLKPLFGFLAKSAKFIFGIFKNLPAIFTALLRAGKALYGVLLGSNPVGWIILAITLLTILYNKSETFRQFVKNLFHLIVEALKLIWNTAMYIITYVIVGLKKVWKWFVKYIWNPIADFFKNAVTWIGQMWDKFMNTAVGKWLDKWIISPLKKVFNWIADVWKSIVDGLGSLVDWFSGANDKMVEATDKLAKDNGVVSLPTFGGGNYYTPNSGSSLAFGGSGSNSGSFLSTPNPIINSSPIYIPPAPANSNITVSSGAINIVVNKGDDIDENVLADKVKQVLMDIQRNGNMRGGTA